MNVLQMFEGLTEEQAKEFSDRILPALEGLRHEITNPNKGVKMTEDMYEELNGFALSEEEIELVRDSVRASVKDAAEKIRQKREPLSAAREAELAGIQRLRGTAYLHAKHAIETKYERLHTEQEQRQQAEKQNTELAGKERGELIAAYRSERSHIRSGDIRGMSELKSKYRPVLPDVDQIGG